MTEAARRTEPLHYLLLDNVAPATLGIPFDKGRWTSRSPQVNLCRELSRVVSERLRRKLGRRIGGPKPSGGKHILVSDTNFERAAWLEKLKDTFLQMCMDDRQSEIWNYVDRDKFATVTSGDDASRAMSRNVKALFLTATVYLYEQQAKSLRAKCGRARDQVG